MFQHLRDFVGAEIEGANDDGQISAGIEHTAVGFEVISFGGFSVTAEEEEFSAIESNSVGSAADTLAHFFGEFDISTDGDSMSIDGFGWESFDLSESFADAQVAGLGITDAGERIGVGVDQYLSVVAIENCVFTTGDFAEAATESDDGGDFQSTGKNGGMTGFSADLGSEAKYEARVEIGCFARGEFVGEENHGFGEVSQFFSAFAEELSEEAFFKVEDVEGSFGEVAIAQFFQLFGIATKDATDGRFRGAAVIADQAFDFANESRVLGHLQMCGEDSAVLLTELGGDEFFVGLDVVADVFQGKMEAVQFCINGVPRDIASGDAKVLGTQHQHRARDNTGRNCNSSENLHPADSSGNSGQRK